MPYTSGLEVDATIGLLERIPNLGATLHTKNIEVAAHFPDRRFVVHLGNRASHHRDAVMKHFNIIGVLVGPDEPNIRDVTPHNFRLIVNDAVGGFGDKHVIAAGLAMGHYFPEKKLLNWWGDLTQTRPFNYEYYDAARHNALLSFNAGDSRLPQVLRACDLGLCMPTAILQNGHNKPKTLLQRFLGMPFKRWKKVLAHPNVIGLGFWVLKSLGSKKQPGQHQWGLFDAKGKITPLGFEIKQFLR